MAEMFFRNQMQQEIWLRVGIWTQIHIITFYAMPSEPDSLKIVYLVLTVEEIHREKISIDLIP